MKHMKLLALSLLLAACATRTAAPTAPDTAAVEAELPLTADQTSAAASGHGPRDPLRPGAATPRGENLRPLPNLDGPRTRLPLRSLAVTPNTDVVALRVLILAGSADSNLDTARAMLAQAGVPFDVVFPAQTPLTPDTLVAPDGSGRYQGVILTTGNLAYESSPGVFQSALDWAGWNLLWQYEKDYRARQLSLYTYPGTWPEDYGLRDAGVSSSTADVKPTASAAGVLSDLRQVAIPVRYAYNYPSTLATVTGVTTNPLLKDGNGRVLGVQSTVDGRERVALTFAQNPYLLHSTLLGYSLTDWLTRGVRLGEYRRFAQLDIDDWFLPGDVYDPATGTVKADAFRITAVDAMNIPVQLSNLRTLYPVASGLNLTMAFNGGGANASAPLSCSSFPTGTPDKLSSATKCLAGTFDWVSHTLNHEYMDFLNYADSYAQLAPNLQVAQAFGLKLSARGLVTGDMSGLGYYNPAGDGPKTNYGLGASNTAFLQAAQATGVQYLASNRSVDGQWDPGCVNCGLYHPLNPSIFLVPRWPTNVFYSVTNPNQAVSAYNSVYGPTGTAPYWDHNLTYSEFLDKESDLALSHVLSGSAFPHYMHQNNLRQYSLNKSLASDWLGAVLKKYARYSSLPLNTLRWDDLGPYMRDRTLALKAGVSATWNRAAASVTVTSAQGGPAFVTGARGGTQTSYGGRTISLVTLGAGQSVTLPTQ